MPASDATPRGAAGLFSLLYVSEMTRPEAGAVERICEQSHANNERDGITGLLVFDGHAFCQLVEGPQAVITALRDRLQRDPRHVGMRILQFGAAPHERRFPSWRLGYAFAADPAAIECLEASCSGAALAAFDSWLPSLTPEP